MSKVTSTINIPQPSIAGRIGTGIGKGLAEQLPEEITRGRLSHGLNQVANQRGLTPFQQFSQLASTPGITPQMLQSGAELLKQQGIRQAYGRGRNPEGAPGQGGMQGETGHPMQPLPGFNIPGRQGSVAGQGQSQGQSALTPNLPSREQALANEPAARENPLSDKFTPAAPWNQEKQEDAINEAFNRGVATNFNEASDYANRQREIYENAPEAYRKQLDYQKGVDNEVDDLFDKDLKTRLQKEGNETYKDATGDFQLNLKKLARNKVATGEMTPRQAAEYYSTKALDLAKSKNRVSEIANRDIMDKVLPHKKEQTLKNLESIADTWSELGNSEELYNLLRSNLDLSPGGAAAIAYKPKGSLKSFLDKSNLNIGPSNKSTKRFAEKLFEHMGPNDSFLSVAREMKHRDPLHFDERAFFDYLRENRDKYGYNPRLVREIDQGVSDFFPNWGDIALFPATKG